MRTRETCASAALSRNLSTRSVASSTVEPIKLISSVAAPSFCWSRTETLLCVVCTAAAGPSIPTISSTATFMRNGPASISAELPSMRRKMTGLLKPRTRMRAPACKRSLLMAPACADVPRSACESDSVCTNAAFSSSRASPRTSCTLRREDFSICPRNSRSFTASTTRATFSSKRFCISANLSSSSLMRFCCRPTHSVRNFARSSSNACRSAAICCCMRSNSSRLRCKYAIKSAASRDSGVSKALARSIIGSANPNRCAIAIPQRLGLAEPIIERARALLTPESREAADLIAYLHRSRDELDRMQQQMAAERHALEEERAKLRTEWVGRQQKRIKELEDKFAEMQKRFDENVARVVEAVKERELRGQMEKSSRRKVQDVRGEAREELNAAVVQTISDSQADLGGTSASLQAVTAERLQPGVRVRVRGFSKPVVFRRLDGSSAEIEAGPLRMKVALDEITGVEGDAAVSKSGALVSTLQSVTVTARRDEGTSTDEINVIGMTVEEATGRLDKFLDDAALANRSQVRIIHGHGTGALRKGIGTFLASHPLVERHSFETEERGGKAITIVELQK